MTVHNIQSKITYNGDDTQVTFDFPYLLLDEGDLSVSKIEADGTTIPLALNSDFTIVIDENNTARVTLTAPVGSGIQLSLTRVMALTQLIDFSEGDKFSSSAFEAGLDRLTLLLQQINLANENFLRLPAGSQTNTQLPATVSNAFLSTNADGTEWEYAVPSASIIVAQTTAPDASGYKLWYDTANQTLKYWNGTTWIDAQAAAITGTEGNLAEIGTGGTLSDSGESTESLIQRIDNASIDHENLTNIQDITPEKGGLVVTNANDIVLLSPGENDQVLTANDNTSSGLEWQTPVQTTPASSLFELIQKRELANETTNQVEFIWEPGKYQKLEIIGEGLKATTDTPHMLFEAGYGYFNSNGNEITLFDIFLHHAGGGSAMTSTNNPVYLTRMGNGLNGYLQMDTMYFDFELFNLTTSNRLLVYGPHIVTTTVGTATHRFFSIFSTSNNPGEIDRAVFKWTGGTNFKSEGSIYLYGLKR